MLTRGSVLLFSVTATVMACIRRDIYELVSESSVLSLVSLFCPMVLGMYWNRATATGAIASMFTGIISWFFLQGTETEIPALVPATLISLVTMVVVSLMSQGPEAGSQEPEASS
jgi:solute:Na+ symporter, SSS family